jgi:hypothetical protein
MPVTAGHRRQPSKVIGYLPGATLMTLTWLIVSMSLDLSNSNSRLGASLLTAAGASVLPLIMLSKFFSPVRYYLRLTAFLLGQFAASSTQPSQSIVLELGDRHAGARESSQSQTISQDWGRAPLGESSSQSFSQSSARVVMSTGSSLDPS